MQRVISDHEGCTQDSHCPQSNPQRVASLLHSPQHQFTSKQMETALRYQNRTQQFSLKGPTKIIKSNQLITLQDMQALLYSLSSQKLSKIMGQKGKCMCRNLTYINSCIKKPAQVCGFQGLLEQTLIDTQKLILSNLQQITFTAFFPPFRH